MKLMLISIAAFTTLLFAQGAGSGPDYGMGMGLGAVTIDGEIYNQIALRPEVALGKLGVGLDLVIYLNAQGDIRADEWNEAQDILDKILYLRWGQPGDKLFARYGTLDNVTIGYGILIKNYSNMEEFPAVRQVGAHFGATLPMGPLGVGFEGFAANIKEFNGGPGLMSVRATTNLGKLKFGATYATDGNQYLGLSDRDGDGYPDFADDFPDADSLYIDSDGDGITDADDRDADGDNITDVIYANEIPGWTGGDILLDPSVLLKGEPLNINDTKKSISAISFDVGYPVIEKGPFTMMAAVEFSKFLGDHVNVLSNDTISHGWGFAPGIHGKIMKMVHYDLEYRQSSENFAFGFFDRNYDLQRVMVREDSNGDPLAYTKDMGYLETPALKGIYGGLSANIANFLTITGSYLDMRQDTIAVKGVTASIGLAENSLPKLKEAKAYFERMNREDPFNFVAEGSILGYRAAFELGGGVILAYDFKQSYRDVNGDGEIDTSKNSDEVIAITSIETGFTF